MQEKLCAINHLFDFSLELDEPYLADNGKYGIPKEVASRFYFVNGKISLYYNKNTELYNEILCNTVKSVALSFNDYQEYEKKGIMLDLGHYMNTNTRLRTPGQAVDYLHRMLDLHEKKGVPVTDWIKGIHLQMSLGGSYTMKHKREWKKGKNRLNFDEIPFYELFRLAYEHVNNIDQHLPFLEEGVKELIRRIGPEYITFEFKQRSKEEYLQYITDQGKMLGYV